MRRFMHVVYSPQRKNKVLFKVYTQLTKIINFEKKLVFWEFKQIQRKK